MPVLYSPFYGFVGGTTCLLIILRNALVVGLRLGRRSLLSMDCFRTIASGCGLVWAMATASTHRATAKNCQFFHSGLVVLTTPHNLRSLQPKIIPDTSNVTLSVLSPTSFRRKGSHFPLPLPFNLFRSYLRRWNDFSSQSIAQNKFLNWIDESVVLLRHQM
jgi:CRISPR-associated endoribonuclease Cas6